MKKIIITIAIVCGISTGAFAQGSLILGNNSAPGGLNTTTASDAAGSGWYSGLLTLEVFAVQSNSVSQWSTVQSDVSAINGDSASSSVAYAALISDGWLQQSVGGFTGTNVTVTTGNFNIGTVTIGTSGTLATSSSTDIDTIYALVGIAGGLEGVLVFNPSATGAPSPGTPVNSNTLWPGQNMYLTPVPEPASMALAGLSGAALLFFRRKKA